ncbi:MAG: DUF1190 domain-containing protein [Cyanobacteria bacterium P01_G01_bin.19]
MPKKIDPALLKLRSIKRKQVQHVLAITASFAILISGCGSNNGQSISRRSARNSGDSRVTPANANDKINAVFYENVEQCEADIQKQQAEYQVLLQAHQKGELSNQPTPPIMEQESCAAQIQAAKEEHVRNAPVYDSQRDCEADGVRCERTPPGYYRSGYRPVFGGTYFYPYGTRSYIYVRHNGVRHRVYQPRTVYRSTSSNRVVTPLGRTVDKSTPGKVKVPRHTSAPAPQRPKGKAARGTIKGRGSKGFGSTFKGTGRGGK